MIHHQTLKFYLSIYTNVLLSLVVIHVTNLFETFKKKGLGTSENLAQSEISQCSEYDGRWYDLIIDSVFAKHFLPKN